MEYLTKIRTYRKMIENNNGIFNTDQKLEKKDRNS